MSSVDPFEEAMERAKSRGVGKFSRGGSSFYLVSADNRPLSKQSLYEGADKLLRPPEARAAYSDRTAWLMATLAKLAYEPFEKNEAEREKLALALSAADICLIETYDDYATGTQAFCAVRPGEFCVIAFRGTEKNKKDILTDLKARFYNSASGRTHEGFTIAYEGIKSSIRNTLREREDGKQVEPLYLTGHSLGGALATIAAKDLERDFVVSSCYTFGSPRVGTPEWSDYFKTPVYRIVHLADAVPTVPLSGAGRNILSGIAAVMPVLFIQKMIEKILKSGFAGYQHVGDFRFVMGKNESTHLKMGSAATAARFRYIVVGTIGRAIKKMMPKALAGAFADHGIDHYVGKLRQIAIARNSDGMGK